LPVPNFVRVLLEPVLHFTREALVAPEGLCLLQLARTTARRSRMLMACHAGFLGKNSSQVCASRLI
jgi:hypothetical protein